MTQRLDDRRPGEPSGIGLIREGIGQILRRLATIRLLSALAALAGLLSGALGIYRYVNSLPGAHLSGDYLITNRIESSSLKRYVGLELTYRVTFVQQDRILHGHGEKYLENGTRIGATARSPIDLDCEVQEDHIQCTTREQGARRDTSGSYRWAIGSGGEFRGRFTSTAADSAGSSVLAPAKGPAHRG
ncbi:hypothetical protein L6R50_28050 [Myxococcota bacterium]|nr:hypothetical protein [Myxococcota bacterium]